jgi:hypothetical protein
MFSYFPLGVDFEKQMLVVHVAWLGSTDYKIKSISLDKDHLTIKYDIKHIFLNVKLTNILADSKCTEHNRFLELTMTQPVTKYGSSGSGIWGHILNRRGSG